MVVSRVAARDDAIGGDAERVPNVFQRFQLTRAATDDVDVLPPAHAAGDHLHRQPRGGALVRHRGGNGGDVFVANAHRDLMRGEFLAGTEMRVIFADERRRALDDGENRVEVPILVEARGPLGILGPIRGDERGRGGDGRFVGG